MTQFRTESVSIAGAPTITFEFLGDTCRAEVAGAKLYAEARGDGRAADLRINDEGGELLADLVVNERAHRTLTENLIDIGSALLWSHWRWKKSTDAESDAPLESRIMRLAVNERARGIDDPLVSLVNWEDFATVATRLCAKVEGDGQQVSFDLFTPAGRITVRPSLELKPNEIKLERPEQLVLCSKCGDGRARLVEPWRDPTGEESSRFPATARGRQVAKCVCSSCQHEGLALKANLKARELQRV